MKTGKSVSGLASLLFLERYSMYLGSRGDGTAVRSYVLIVGDVLFSTA